MDGVYQREHYQEAPHNNEPRGVKKWWHMLKRWFWIGWLVLQWGFDKLIDSQRGNYEIIKKEADLFFGTALTIMGLLGFSSSKFCDGNTADYLSCTRPTSYHYYSAFAIFLVIIGVFFILFWFLKRRK